MFQRFDCKVWNRIHFHHQILMQIKNKMFNAILYVLYCMLLYSVSFRFPFLTYIFFKCIKGLYWMKSIMMNNEWMKKSFLKRKLSLHQPSKTVYEYNIYAIKTFRNQKICDLSNGCNLKKSEYKWYIFLFIAYGIYFNKEKL